MTKSGETLPLAPKIDVSYISKIVIVVTFFALFLWSWIKIDMSIFGFFSDFQNVINLFGRMYPPDFAEISTVISAMIETLWIALLGTLGAVLLSYPLALLAASNTSPNRALRAFSRGAITLSRAVPEIILAAIFVVAFAIYFVLRSAHYLAKILGASGIVAISRIIGFLTIAIGIQYIISSVLSIVRGV